jgi:type I restriction enzyme S subunit
MSWKQTTLGEVADIVSGATPKSDVLSYWDGPVAWATPTDLSQLNGKYISKTIRTISEDGLSACSTRLLPPGSVLFSSRAPIGLVAINTKPMATNQGFKSFVPRPGLSADFLFWWLKSNRKQLEDLGNGATFKEVSKAVVSRVPLLLPSLSEQRRIAAILDKADDIRRKREQALALAEDFLRSAYLHLVGMKHPGFLSWRPASIESLAEDKRGSIRSGPFGSALLHSEFGDEGIAVLGIDNAVNNKFQWAERRFITPEKYEELRRYRVYPKDVIITIMGTTGRSAVVPPDIPEAITTKHLASITCDLTKVVPEFLSFAIHSDPVVIEQIRAANKGAIMDGLNLGIIRQLKIRMPPMAQQLVFGKLLKATNEAIRKMATPSGDGSDLFDSLSQRAFRGEL